MVGVSSLHFVPGFKLFEASKSPYVCFSFIEMNLLTLSRNASLNVPCARLCNGWYVSEFLSFDIFMFVSGAIYYLIGLEVCRNDFFFCIICLVPDFLMVTFLCDIFRVGAWNPVWLKMKVFFQFTFLESHFMLLLFRPKTAERLTSPRCDSRSTFCP